MALDPGYVIKVMRGYSKQFYVNKFFNLNKIYKFLGKCKLPKLTNVRIDNLDIL